MDYHQLVKDCLRGDSAAQRQLYEHFAGNMLGVCYRYTKSMVDAEDVLQEGFIMVFKNLHQFNFTGELGGWVRRIMVHSSIEYYRKHHKMLSVAELEETGKEPSVNPVAIARLDAKDLMALIQQLSPGYRMVFNLYAVEGYSHKEIGEIMGISEGASKSQLSRARAILKEQISQTEGKRYEHAG